VTERVLSGFDVTLDDIILRSLALLGKKGLMVSPASSNSEGNPILRIVQTVYPPLALLAGMQLDLFTSLEEGPLTAEQIAVATGANSKKLKPLLYSLVAAGLLTVEGELFNNTDAVNRFLVRGSPYCMVDSHEVLSDLLKAVLKTAESIRTGLPQAKYDYSAMTKHKLEQFFRGEHSGAVAAGRDLVARFDFSSYRTLLDVGGGSGGLAITVTEAYPHIQATVVDLPTVTPITQNYVNEAGAEGRVQVVAADVLRDSLDGSYDIATLFSFIQILSSDDAQLVIKNVGRVVNPGGAIYIGGGGIIDNSRTSPPEKVGLNLVFINLYDAGQAYTEQEHRDWLAASGFENFERIVLSEGRSIITAQKPR
jgi:ubiquinone/menaquinone biosynthesis C-methylase UbiE